MPTTFGGEPFIKSYIKFTKTIF
ncbi:hypothetical protein [Staphylococcus aureus]